jgi:hypothetical protein
MPQVRFKSHIQVDDAIGMVSRKISGSTATNSNLIILLSLLGNIKIGL